VDSLTPESMGTLVVADATAGVFFPVSPAATPRPSQRSGTFPDTLIGLYEQYCAAEVADLISLVPQSALRDFLRSASAWTAPEDRVSDPGSPSPLRHGLSHDDALAQVRRYARSLLPLPPYEVWVGSYLQNRGAYLDCLGIASAPRREEPVMVAIQEFGEGWYAALYLSYREEGWSGSIHFHRSEGVRSYRTTDIFREADPDEIRTRFLSFDSATLHAFLRSVLP
jgi:hypothetical protein